MPPQDESKAVHEKESLDESSPLCLDGELSALSLPWKDWGERLVIPEWDVHSDETTESTSTLLPQQDNDQEESYRQLNGWKGTDFMHSRHSPVRITSYFCRYGSGADIVVASPPTTSSSSSTNPNADDAPSHAQPHRGGSGTILTGLVHFTAAAESHAGYCHGGSMCSVMDDAVGWVAFLVTGSCRPWTGYTVQINTSLHKPVPIGSTLIVEAEITKVERRKVLVSANLYDYQRSTGTAADHVVHATCEGVVVLNKGILVTDVATALPPM